MWDQRDRWYVRIEDCPRFSVMVVISLNFARCTLPTHGNRKWGIALSPRICLLYGPSLQGSWAKTEDLLFYSFKGSCNPVNKWHILWQKQKYSKNLLENFAEIIFHEICLKSFFQATQCLILSENCETILVNVLSQFSLAAESIRQNGAILPDDQPIRLWKGRAGWVAIYELNIVDD